MDQARAVILVTGGAGYIGSHLVLALLDRGYAVTVVDNLSTGVREAVDARANLVEAELEDGATLVKLMQRIRPDAVVHLAASISAEDSVSQPLDYYRNNTSATVSLLQACLAAGIDKIVFSSTAAVYGQPPEPLVDETAPTHPVTPYGASKLMSEDILADAARSHGVRYCALRYFNVAGADPKGRAGQRSGARSLIKTALDVALGRRPVLRVFGADFDTADGSGVRDYIHVSDLASAHLLVLERLLAGVPVPDALNCGYGKGCSVFDVIETVNQITGRRTHWQLVGRRPGDLASVVADSSRLKALGWTPEFASLRAMISTAYDWEQSREAHGANA